MFHGLQKSSLLQRLSIFLTHAYGDRKGFTLLEVIAVMIIMGVISAIVVSRLGITENALPEHTEVLKSHLRYTQSRSMNANTPYGIRFLSDSSYAFFASGAVNPEILPGEASLLVQLPAGVQIHDGDPDSNVISFNSWGEPCTDSNATQRQASVRQITVSTDTESRVISVYKNTGFIP